MKSLVNLSIILSLSSAAFVSCSNEDDLKVATGYVPLDIAAVSAASNTQTRAAIDADAFPVSDAASIGLFVTGEGGGAYNGKTSGYSNVAYTKAADATVWSCASPILLSSTAGKLYGYYPYSADATVATAIPVTSSVDGDDYMYLSSPTATINAQTQMPVAITMQHALSRLDISFVKSETVSSASLSSFTLTGDGVATSGTMNILEGGEITATKASAGFTYTPASAVALSASNTYKCLLVPATQDAKDLTISCVINGTTFSKTLTSVALKPGTRTAVTLTLTGTGVEVSNVSVTGWTTNEAPGGVSTNTITATVADFITEDGSTSPYNFTWKTGDVLGVFPEGRKQLDADVISSGIGASSAVFDMRSLALQSGYKIATYYPFNSENYTNALSSLPVSYVGQEMDGNNPYAHLSKYDFVASAPQETSGSGTVNLDLKHLGCLAMFELTLPEPGTYSYLNISCEAPVFVHEATFDLSSATPALTPKKSYSTYKINLENVTTTEANQRVDVPIMVAPVNLSGKTLTLSIIKNNGKLYSTTVSGKNMIAGKAYGYTPSDAFTEVDVVPGTLKSGKEFNAAIKKLAKRTYASYNDTDNSIQTILFDYNSPVSSGEKVSTSDSNYPIYANYADGVITISTPAAKIGCSDDMSYMFSNCKALTSLDLSSFDTRNVTTMVTMFANCHALTSLELSSFDTQNVTNMSSMFSNCKALTSLELSSFDTQNVTDMSIMFYDCESLISLDLSSFDTKKVKSMWLMFGKCYAIMSLNLSSFSTLYWPSVNTTDMFLNFADNSQECSISCTKSAKDAFTDSKTALTNLYITWNILP